MPPESVTDPPCSYGPVFTAIESRLWRRYHISIREHLGEVVIPEATGTFDPSAWLAAADAISYIGSLVDGGWPEVMRRNSALALRGRDILCRHLGIEHPAPDSMLGSMAALLLPDGNAQTAPSLYGDPLQDVLLEQHHIEVPLVPWPRPPKRALRISAHLYNTESEYDELGRTLRMLL